MAKAPTKTTTAKASPSRAAAPTSRPTQAVASPNPARRPANPASAVKGNAAPVAARASRASQAQVQAPAPEPEVFEEVVEQAEEVTQFSDEQNDVNEEAGAGNTGDDVLLTSTDELDSPTRPADAHRGRITTVEAIVSSQKGTPGIQVNLHSDDLDFDDKFLLWVPPTWASDISISPLDLPLGEKQVVDGKLKTVGNEQGSYAQNIHNKKNDAEVDKLRILARAQSRTLEGAVPPTTFEEWVALLNQLLADLPVVFLRRPDRQNPKFLRVSSIVDIDTVENDTKIFKGYIKAWDPQA